MADSNERQNNIELLRVYSTLPALWDVNHEDYSDPLMKEQQFRILLEKYRETNPNAYLGDLKRRINTLRTNYRRELRRLKTAAMEGRPEKCNLYYFKEISFLNGIKTRQSNVKVLQAIKEKKAYLAHAKSNGKQSITKRFKRGKPNKKWTEEETREILNYLEDAPEIELPTAQIFYKKLIERTGIDANWELIRWKVRHLKASFRKANDWLQNMGVRMLDSDEGTSSLEGEVLQMCPHYRQLSKIFGEKYVNVDLAAIDSGDAITLNDSIIKTEVTEIAMDSTLPADSPDMKVNFKSSKEKRTCTYSHENMTVSSPNGNFLVSIPPEANNFNQILPNAIKEIEEIDIKPDVDPLSEEVTACHPTFSGINYENEQIKERHKQFEQAHSASKQTNDLQPLPVESYKPEHDTYRPLCSVWSQKLMKIGTTQRIFAEKLINDVLFHGELGLLNFNTSIANFTPFQDLPVEKGARSNSTNDS